MLGSSRRAAILALAVGLAGTGLAGCGGGGGEEAAPAPPPSEPAPPAEGGGQGDAAAGAQIWEELGCGSCHILAAAGSSGSVGPNLDDLKPGFDQTAEQVTNGGGGMPAFGGQLSEQQIADVAAYVVASTSG